MTWRKWNSKRKYGEEKVEKYGFRFDSKLEGALYEELKLMEKAGEISELRHHPGTIFLTRARIQYRPDFRFVRCTTGEVEYAEAKGFANDKWPLKKALWRFYGPAKLSIYIGSHKRLVLDEVIIPKGGEDVSGGRQGAVSEGGE